MGLFLLLLTENKDINHYNLTMTSLPQTNSNVLPGPAYIPAGNDIGDIFFIIYYV